ncbi:hypothetical protein V8E54_000285 [Elaphomyces granulatus]
MFLMTHGDLIARAAPKVKGLDVLNSRNSNNRVKARSRLLSFLKALQQHRKLTRLRHDRRRVGRLPRSIRATLLWLRYLEESASGPSKMTVELENLQGSSPNGLENSDRLICPHCSQVVECRPPTAIPQLHPDTISTAHTTFEDWKKEVNEAIKFRLDGTMHDDVRVLLLTWQDNDLGSKAKGSLILDETQDLERVFRDEYGYNTRHYQIPSKFPEVTLQNILAQIVADLETNEEIKKPLLIIYYNGHAFRSSVTNDFMFSASALMQHSKSTYSRNSSEYPGLSWTALQSILERANLDRLFLFDCCYSAAALTKGCSEHIMEFLTASGREVKIPGPKWTPYVGSAFTQTLLKYLKQGARRPRGMLVTELQAFLSLDKNLDKQSPNHTIVQGHRRSLVLKPLKNTMVPPQSIRIEKGLCRFTAIVAVSFKGATPINTELMSNWLGNQIPEGVANIKVEAMHIESIYESWSTFMEVAIPLWLWACLTDVPGCSLVGFVKTTNVKVDYSKPVADESIDANNNKTMAETAPRSTAFALTASTLNLRLLVATS